MGYKKDEIERLREELTTLQAAYDTCASERSGLRNEVEKLKSELHFAKYPNNGTLVAKMVANYCNSFGTDHKAFVNQMLSEHRTLQQSVMRLMLQTIEAFAKEGYYDGRNEATVLLSRKIVNAFGDEFRLPLI